MERLEKDLIPTLHPFTLPPKDTKVSTRTQNESKFGSWEDLPSGGRLYRLFVSGRLGWKACYCKEVDPDETTVRFWQEIYDTEGRLVERHEKYPEDKGHQQVS